MVVEKAIIMGLATGTKKASGALVELVTTYASILAAQVGDKSLLVGQTQLAGAGERVPYRNDP